MFHNFLTTTGSTVVRVCAMTRFRWVIGWVGAAGFSFGCAEAADATKAVVASQPLTAELRALQGTWEGGVVGDDSHGRITVTITGNAFRFHRDTNFWFATTIVLPPKTEPRQLHATIKECAKGQEDSVGKTVVAIYKVEDGRLTLATRGGGVDESPTSFDASEDKGLSRYELRRLPTEPRSAAQPRK